LQQLIAIEYLKAENGLLRERLKGRGLRFTNAERDRAFVPEALCAAADRFEYLAHTSDESLFEHYEIKRAACLRLAGDIDADK
jgi:hypothetical protein